MKNIFKRNRFSIFTAASEILLSLSDPIGMQRLEKKIGISSFSPPARIQTREHVCQIVSILYSETWIVRHVAKELVLHCFPMQQGLAVCSRKLITLTIAGSTIKEFYWEMHFIKVSFNSFSPKAFV